MVFWNQVFQVFVFFSALALAVSESDYKGRFETMRDKRDKLKENCVTKVKLEAMKEKGEFGRISTKRSKLVAPLSPLHHHLLFPPLGVA